MQDRERADAGTRHSVQVLSFVEIALGVRVASARYHSRFCVVGHPEPTGLRGAQSPFRS